MQICILARRQFEETCSGLSLAGQPTFTVAEKTKRHSGENIIWGHARQPTLSLTPSDHFHIWGACKKPFWDAVCKSQSQWTLDRNELNVIFL